MQSTQEITIAFEDMVTEYRPMLIKICRVYSEAHDFDDLYQEILINLWKAYKKFRGEAKLSTWLYKVALNTGLTYRRNEKNYKKKVAAQSALPDQKWQTNDEDLELKVNSLNKAIRKLNKADRALILLYLEEKSYNEISEILGITNSNVGVKINRIKKKLYEILKPKNDER